MLLFKYVNRCFIEISQVCAIFVLATKPALCFGTCLDEAVFLRKSRDLDGMG